MALYHFTGLYLLLVVCSMVFSIIEYRLSYNARKFFVIFSILFLSVMMGLRPMDVPDTIVYYKIYNQNTNLSSILQNGFIFGGRYNSIEYMYYVLVEAAHIIGLSFQTFMGLLAFCCNCSIMIGLANLEMYLYQPRYKIIRNKSTNLQPGIKEDTPLISIWTVYLYLFGFMYSGIAVRSMISMAFGMIAITILLRNNSIKYFIISVLLILLGTSLQSFGLLYFIILLLMMFSPKVTKKRLIITWIALILLMIFRLGEKWANSLTEIMIYIKKTLGITAFTSYISTTEFIISKWDWYYVLVIGTIIVLTFMEYPSDLNLYMLILIGLAIIAILYPFMAVSRIADYFMMFLVPVAVSTLRFNKKISFKRVFYEFILILLLPIQILIFIKI